MQEENVCSLFGLVYSDFLGVEGGVTGVVAALLSNGGGVVPVDFVDSVAVSLWEGDFGS